MKVIYGETSFHLLIFILTFAINDVLGNDRDSYEAYNLINGPEPATEHDAIDGPFRPTSSIEDSFLDQTTSATTARPTSRRTLIPRRVYSPYKHERPHNRFLNYGRKKVKPGIELENEILKSKVDVLGSILKLHVQTLRKVNLSFSADLFVSFHFSDFNLKYIFLAAFLNIFLNLS